MGTKGLLQFKIIIKCFSSLFRIHLTKLCYWSTAIGNIFQQGSCLYTSESDFCRHQILTYRDGPRAERVSSWSHRSFWVNITTKKTQYRGHTCKVLNSNISSNLSKSSMSMANSSSSPPYTSSPTLAWSASSPKVKCWTTSSTWSLIQVRTSSSADVSATNKMSVGHSE